LENRQHIFAAAAEALRRILIEAAAPGLARAPACRHWAFARAWLRCELGDQRPDEKSPPA
jgi:hypothetical protein